MSLAKMKSLFNNLFYDLSNKILYVTSLSFLCVMFLELLSFLDSIFKDEFIRYVKNQDPNLYEYPHLYDFVKNRIWYIIIHQQQIEGLFNQ